MYDLQSLEYYILERETWKNYYFWKFSIAVIFVNIYKFWYEQFIYAGLRICYMQANWVIFETVVLCLTW